MAKKNQIKKPFYKQAFPMIVFILLIIYVASFIIPFLWGVMTTFVSYDKYLEITGNVKNIGKEVYEPFSKAQIWEMILMLPTNLRDGKTNEFLDISGFAYAEGMVPDYEGIKVEELAHLGRSYEWAIYRLAVDLGVRIEYPELMLRTFIYALGGTLISTFTHAISAYMAARYSQHFVAKCLYPIVIVTMIIPIVGALPSELDMMIKLNWYDQLYGLLLMKGGFLGTNFLIFYATFKGISWEYAEAAFVDGASHFRVLFQIMIPLAATSLGALALISFITYWNDWRVNMTYIPTNWPMISYALYKFTTSSTIQFINVPIQMAAAIIVAVPLIVIFVIFRKQLMGNLTIGGIKG